MYNLTLYEQQLLCILCWLFIPIPRSITIKNIIAYQVSLLNPIQTYRKPLNIKNLGVNLLNKNKNSTKSSSC